MLDLFLKLIAQLTMFAQTGERNRRQYIDRYVQPVYKTTEEIYKDYCTFLRDLRGKIKRGKKCEPLIRYIETRRLEMLPARIQVRALLAKRLDEGAITGFEVGILGLMTGSLSTLETSYFRFSLPYVAVDPEWNHRPHIERFADLLEGHTGRFLKDHTVLSILEQITDGGDTDFTRRRSDLLESVDKKIYAVNKAWEAVTIGYAELHSRTLPKQKNKVQSQTSPQKWIYKHEGD